ncbi:MAG: hypothetical protein PHX70_14140 [Clostridium sp.]|nr:hypothetical protein [Clostridium sp.]
MKYNLSTIMKRAWEIKKENKKNIFGICLQIAWEEVKKAATKRIEVIKDWFMNKKFGKEVSNFGDKLEVIRETEKAVLGNIYYTNGMPMEIWVPKSCLY